MPQRGRGRELLQRGVEFEKKKLLTKIIKTMRTRDFLAVVACAAMMTACNENTTDNTGVNVNDVTGEYAGYSVANSQFFTDMVSDKETVNVEAEGDESVKVTYVSGMFGEFTLSGCTVAKDGDGMKITGEGVTLMGMGEEKSEYAATIEAAIGANKASAEFAFTAPDVMGGTTIRFVQGTMPAALGAAGDYEGSLTLSVSGSEMGGVDTIGCHITRVSDETVNIALDEFEAMGSMMFTLNCENIGVSGTDGSYTLSGEIDTMSGETEVTGTVSGTVTDGKAEITFTFRPGAMPMDVTAVFKSF